jgi:hypothetical protein
LGKRRARDDNGEQDEEPWGAQAPGRLGRLGEPGVLRVRAPSRPREPIEGRLGATRPS